METKTRFALLSNRKFRLIFSSYSLATFGDWFDMLAIQVLVAYRWGADPLMIALIPVVMALPGLLLGSVAGTIVDRVQKARIMMICDVGTAALTLCVLMVSHMAWLLPLLALRSAMSVFHVPAQQALTKQVVPSHLLLQATSLNGLVNQSSKVAGPLLGAFALVIMSPQLCIIVNAITRLISAMLLWPLRSMREENVDDEGEQENLHRSFWEEWRDGWRFMLHAKRVLHTLVYGSFGLLSILMIDYQFSTVLRDINPSNESLLGWFVSAIGVGAVIVILFLNRLTTINSGWGFGGGYIFIGVGILLLGSSKPGIELSLLLCFGFLIGVGNGLYMVTHNYTLQQDTPSHMTGRIFGIQNTIVSFIMLVAPLTGGLLIRSVGAGQSFVIIGIITSVLGLLGLLLSRLLWPIREQKVADVIGINERSSY
ncbi:MFS transporter [Paenibacillus sp. GSMTC-2017]|uniref:MFS transporter n=1 Tax=Paenibacillus sp. GSMTC-2017 TaxID=2794350 RepID=UPI0018D9F7C5|nr:MFS transporter [Paenibacillus sp. GSMTC-2017]MBH5320942.1 MFS transporter [Paenibacillus sp. GSMTC-2017]